MGFLKGLSWLFGLLPRVEAWFAARIAIWQERRRLTREADVDATTRGLQAKIEQEQIQTDVEVKIKETLDLPTRDKADALRDQLRRTTI